LVFSLIVGGKMKRENEGEVTGKNKKSENNLVSKKE
jgi:hypothetical protein